jgi:hypothetical protein
MIKEPEEPKAMKEIHDIRLQIYEDTKDLPDEQRAERTRSAVKEVEKLYGIKFRRIGDRPGHEVM